MRQALAATGARSVLRRVVALCALAAGLATTVAHGADRPGALPDLRVAKGHGSIAEAWLADATTRYRHFVLGSEYEAGSLVVRLRDGRVLKLALPDDSVFEDRQPRIAVLDATGEERVIVVRSYLDRGAALAVIGVVGDRLQVIAETPPTGSRNTWLNPIGVADFDGDGRPDIAYVQMPHVLGRLRIWTLNNGRLVEIASLADTSNHAAGSPRLGLAAIADFDGDGVADIAVPSLDRRTLRFLSFKGGAREIGRRALPSPAVQDFTLEQQAGKFVVVVGLGHGRTMRIGLEAQR